jgi:hypothetical protein
MGPNDFVKPAVGLLAVAAVTTLGFAAGYIVARDPALLRRLARSIAGGLERVSSAVALSREELGDLWAEVRDEAQHAGDDGSAADAPLAAAGATAAKRTAKKPASKGSQKRPRATARPRASRPRSAKRVSSQN